MQHDTQTQLIVKPKFWADLFTAPRIITFIVAIGGGGMWLQAVRSEIAQLRERVVSLELRVNQEATASALIYMRRDVLSSELTAIREEQTRMREAIQQLRRDLR